MTSSSNSKPKRVPKRAPVRKKPAGLQWQLDQELADQIEAENRKVSKAEGEGEGSNPDNIYPVSQDIGDLLLPPYPPSPFTEPVTAIDGDGTLLLQAVEKLLELEITNAFQLVRKYDAIQLLGAAADFERAIEDGFSPRHPTRYFWSLLE